MPAAVRPRREKCYDKTYKKGTPRMLARLKSKLISLSDNDKIVYANVLGSFLVKGGALIVALFTLPAYMRFFRQDEVLGLWYTILSILNWILYFDFGIGNGLRNHLSESLSSGDREATKKYISSAYIVTGAITCGASLVFPLLIRSVDLNALFNIDKATLSPRSLFVAAVIVFCGVMLQLWLKLIHSVLYAMQKSSITNFLLVCTNGLLLLAALLLPSADNETNIIVMAVAYAVAVALPLLVASFCVFGRSLRYALPRFRLVTREHTKKVLSLGGAFFFVQIAYMTIMSTNELLITQTAGSAHVVEYQAYYRLFTLGWSFLAPALSPIWSVITKAKAENNLPWIRATYRRFMLLGLLFSAGQLLVIPLTRPLMTLWLGADALPEVSLLTASLFAVLGCLLIFSSVLSNVASGLGTLGAQLWCFVVGAAAKIPLSCLFVPLLGTWKGVIVANVLCLAIYCIVEPIVMHRQLKIEK